MQFTTTVTQKGQATIPASMREKLGIKPNSKVIFEFKEDTKEITVKPAVDFLSLRGSVKSDKPFDIEAMDNAIKDSFSRE